MPFYALASAINNIRVIDAVVPLDQYVPIDLSVDNRDLVATNVQHAEDFENYIDNYLKKNNAKIAYGGYNETRNLYKRSSIFNDADSEERNIHIGLDLWTKAGAPVLAALDGSVHSFANNAGLGNYGPTIILQHQLDQSVFYTLYGHLSAANLETIQIGKAVKKGEQIGTLGTASENGNYAPHLHFQIIIAIGTQSGDYPGVCSKNDLHFYMDNCPDPNLLLKINQS